MSRVVGLLRTEDPVVLRVTEQPAAALRVTDAPVRLALTPAATTLLVTDRQGPAGPPGDEGDRGPSGDFGDISYSAADASTIDLPVGVPTRFPLLVASGASTANLRAPFTDHAFFHDGSFWPNSPADSFILRIKMVFNSGVAGGHVRANLLINSTSQQADNTDRNLILPALSDETVPFSFNFFARQTFFANGGSLWLTPSVSLTARLMTAWVKPIGSA